MLNYQHQPIAYLCAVTRRLKGSNFKKEGFICPTVSKSMLQHVQHGGGAAGLGLLIATNHKAGNPVLTSELTITFTSSTQ